MSGFHKILKLMRTYTVGI